MKIDNPGYGWIGLVIGDVSTIAKKNVNVVGSSVGSP
jgi:hypothetical protein